MAKTLEIAVGLVALMVDMVFSPCFIFGILAAVAGLIFGW